MTPRTPAAQAHAKRTSAIEAARAALKQVVSAAEAQLEILDEAPDDATAVRRLSATTGANIRLRLQDLDQARLDAEVASALLGAK